MTAESPSPILYLDKEDIEVLHATLVEWGEREGEPVPPFSLAKEGDVDVLIQMPQQKFFGREAYPTLEEKAAITFYTVNKRQIFLNGNKRMSTLCLIVFLGINLKTLDVAPGELTQKALWLANTDSLEFPAIKRELVEWIASHLKEAPSEDFSSSSS